MRAGLHGTKTLKETDMKKLLAFIILSIAMVSCYDDYIYDFTYSAIYFPYQIDVRTFVVGEGMKFEVGAALSGVRKNTVDRNVSFSLDNTLITPAVLANMKAASAPYIKNPATPVAALLPLPANYYTISNPNTMIIKAGWHEVTFLNDSLKTQYATYVLPFYIVSADADSVKALKRSNVVGVRFENMLFGNYWHGGAALVNRPAKADTTIIYRWAVNDGATKIWTLTSTGPSTLVSNGYLNQQTTKKELQLVLKGTDVYVGAAAGSTNPYLQDGSCTFNNPKLLQDRKIFLKYSYVSGGNTYHCTDTLYFRNRIRDGINEWQDENPAHYLK
jgi:hypothetical protein